MYQPFDASPGVDRSTPISESPQSRANLHIDGLKQHFLHLQTKYSLLQSWSFKLDNAKRRAGICYLAHREIAISRHHIALNEWPVVLDTLLHEVAHALAYELHRDSGHGPQWRSWVEKLGGKALVKGEFNVPDSKWALVYHDAHNRSYEKLADRHRRNRRIKHYAINGRPETQGQLGYVASSQYHAWTGGHLVYEKVVFVQ